MGLQACERIVGLARLAEYLEAFLRLCSLPLRVQ